MELTDGVPVGKHRYKKIQDLVGLANPNRLQGLPCASRRCFPKRTLACGTAYDHELRSFASGTPFCRLIFQVAALPTLSQTAWRPAERLSC